MKKAQTETKGELIAIKKECKVRHDKVTQKTEEMGQMIETKERQIKEHIVMRERRMKEYRRHEGNSGRGTRGSQVGDHKDKRQDR